MRPVFTAFLSTQVHPAYESSDKFVKGQYVTPKGYWLQKIMLEKGRKICRPKSDYNKQSCGSTAHGLTNDYIVFGLVSLFNGILTFMGYLMPYLSF